MVSFRSPAATSDCLELAPPTRFGRKCTVLMALRSETISFHDDDNKLLGVAYLWPREDGLHEFCLAISPDAARHMLALCRKAQLTLDLISETGRVVVCHVRRGNTAGERMARLVGFAPSPNKSGLWFHIWR